MILENSNWQQESSMVMQKKAKVNSHGRLSFWQWFQNLCDLCRVLMDVHVSHSEIQKWYFHNLRTSVPWDTILILLLWGKDSTILRSNWYQKIKFVKHKQQYSKPNTAFGTMILKLDFEISMYFMCHLTNQIASTWILAESSHMV